MKKGVVFLLVFVNLLTGGLWFFHFLGLISFKVTILQIVFKFFSIKEDVTSDVPLKEELVTEKTTQIKGSLFFLLKFQEFVESLHIGTPRKKEELRNFCEKKNLSAPYLRRGADIQLLSTAWSPSSFHSLNNVESFGRSIFEIKFPNGTTMSQSVET